MSETKVTSTELAPGKTTDANSWVIYDFGSFKQYVKTFTYGAGTSFEFANIALPVGKTVSQLTGWNVQGIVTDNGQYASIYWGIKWSSGVSSNTSINIYRNVVTGSSGNGSAVITCVDV